MNIYIAGNSVFAESLYHALSVILNGSSVFWISSADPHDVKEQMEKTQEMGVMVSYPSQDSCILDCTALPNPASICVPFINHLRDDPNLRWEGHFIALVKDKECQEQLHNTDLFGSVAERYFSFSSIEGHTSQFSPVIISKLLAHILEKNHIANTAWKTKEAQGAIPCFLSALDSIEQVIGAEKGDLGPLRGKLLEHLNRFAPEGRIERDHRHEKASEEAVQAEKYFREDLHSPVDALQEMIHVQALRQYAESQIKKQGE